MIPSWIHVSQTWYPKAAHWRAYNKDRTWRWEAGQSGQDVTSSDTRKLIKAIIYILNFNSLIAHATLKLTKGRLFPNGKAIKLVTNLFAKQRYSQEGRWSNYSLGGGGKEKRCTYQNGCTTNNANAIVISLCSEFLPTLRDDQIIQKQINSIQEKENLRPREDTLIQPTKTKINQFRKRRDK